MFLENVNKLPNFQSHSGSDKVWSFGGYSVEIEVTRACFFFVCLPCCFSVKAMFMAFRGNFPDMLLYSNKSNTCSQPLNYRVCLVMLFHYFVFSNFFSLDAFLVKPFIFKFYYHCCCSFVCLVFLYATARRVRLLIILPYARDFLLHLYANGLFGLRPTQTSSIAERATCVWFIFIYHIIYIYVYIYIYTVTKVHYKSDQTYSRKEQRRALSSFIPSGNSRHWEIPKTSTGICFLKII